MSFVFNKTQSEVDFKRHLFGRTIVNVLKQPMSESLFDDCEIFGNRKGLGIKLDTNDVVFAYNSDETVGTVIVDDTITRSAAGTTRAKAVIITPAAPSTVATTASPPTPPMPIMAGDAKEVDGALVLYKTKEYIKERTAGHKIIEHVRVREVIPAKWRWGQESKRKDSVEGVKEGVAFGQRAYAVVRPSYGEHANQTTRRFIRIHRFHTILQARKL